MMYTEAQLIEQSEQFVRANQSEITQIHSAILLAGKDLLSKLGSKLLPPKDLAQALSAQSKGDVDTLFGVLRDNASSFVRARQSKPYWAWIDAAGAYFDAIGTRWLYLTQEDRAFYLLDAQEALTDVRF